MNTTITIKKDVKDKALEKARADGLSMSSVVRILLLDYASGKIQIGTRTAEDIVIKSIEVEKGTQKLMDNVISEWNK